MTNVQHKRGTRAALDALTASSGLVIGQIYYITDEARLAIATGVNSYQAVAKQGEGGSSTWNQFTVTIPGFRGAYEFEATIAAANVTPSDFISLMLAPALDSDENAPDGLLVRSMYAVAGTGDFVLKMTFDELTSGPIKMLWRI